MKNCLFKKIAIVGIGLIGGSIAAACKQHQLVEHCIGIDQSSEHLNFALQAGYIDSQGLLNSLTLETCEYVILCTPVATLPLVLKEALRCLPPTAIITDVGSTKTSLIHAVKSLIKPGQAVFIPAHPIAGSQESGPQAARHDLFENKPTIITPMPDTPEWALKKLCQFWQALGSYVVEKTPECHDEIFAEVSHAPHLLASLAIKMIDEHPEAEQLWALAGTGLRDFTRIGASHPEVWRDICLNNQQAVLNSLYRYQEGLQHVITSLEAKDPQALYNLFDNARLARKKRWM